jgi:type VI secretion system secreted protein Hcp
MMNAGLRTLVRRTLVALALVAALGAGSLAHSSLGSPSSPRGVGSSVPKKLDPSDLLLAAATATGIHLRFTGIPTGPLGTDHTNEIPISSFQFGVARNVSSPAGGTRQAGPANVSEVTLTHATDNFSMALLKASLNGGGTATATLFFTNLTGTGGTPLDYLTVTLGQTFVTQFSMSSGGDNPDESLSLNFATMTFRYKLPTGVTQTVSYNLVTGVTT